MHGLDCPKSTLYLDGDCPVCAREGAMHRGQVPPRWSWRGRLLGSGVGLRLLEAGYRAFLAVRPVWRLRSRPQ